MKDRMKRCLNRTMATSLITSQTARILKGEPPGMSGTKMFHAFERATTVVDSRGHRWWK